ncbi:MAG: UMP kinase [bacterium]
MKKIIVISLGGSLIVPEKIDSDFLSEFKSLITAEINHGYKFILICGGGKTARNYQQAASVVSSIKSEDLDWLGIHATRINAHLLRTIFRSVAESRIVTNPTVNIKFTKNLLIAAGWKPGFSTDFDAVLLAKKFGAHKIINLSNITYVHDKDPNLHKDAKQIKEISWKNFRKLLPKRWSPGLNSPFDPIASKEAESLGLQVNITNGQDLINLKNCLNDEEFFGTIIK